MSAIAVKIKIKPTPTCITVKSQKIDNRKFLKIAGKKEGNLKGVKIRPADGLS